MRRRGGGINLTFFQIRPCVGLASLPNQDKQEIGLRICPSGSQFGLLAESIFEPLKVLRLSLPRIFGLVLIELSDLPGGNE